MVLCLLMSMGMLTGCGSLELDESAEPFVLEDFLEDLGLGTLDTYTEYSTSKEAYLDDVMAMMEMVGYVGYSGAELDEITATIKVINVSTKEGHEIKDAMLKAMELSNEGLELSNNVTEDNFYESYERIAELLQEIDELWAEIEDEKIDKLLLAAKKAGVEAEDLKERGAEEWIELFTE